MITRRAGHGDMRATSARQETAKSKMDLDAQPIASSSNAKAATKAVDLPDPSVFDLQLYADNYQGALVWLSLSLFGELTE